MSSDGRRQLTIAVLIAVLTVASGIKDPGFFAMSNIRDMAISASYIVLVAIGMLGIVITGEIDVSTGAVLAICGAVAGELAKSGSHPVVFIAAAVACGCILGLINGLLVVKGRIPAIVATLGTLSVFRGCFILVTKGKWVTNLPPSILQFGRGQALGIPVSILIAVLVFIAAACVLRYTRYGRNIYSLGSNASAAHLAGIATQKVKASTFVIAGGLNGLASVIFAGLYGSIQSSTGTGLEMTAIASVVVGGASINGGSGTALGTVFGAILITMISTVLIFFQISAYWEQAVHGLLILVAVGYYSLATGKSHRPATTR